MSILRRLLCVVLVVGGRAALPAAEPAKIQEERLDVLIADDGTGLGFQGKIDFGPLKVGTEAIAELRLLNTTDQTIRFDAVKTGCTCSHFRPTSGEVQPGDWLDVRLKFTTAGRPSSTRSGGVIRLLDGAATICQLFYSHGIEDHIGFASKMVLVERSPSSKTERFTVPLVIGTNLTQPSAQVELQTSRVQFDYRIDRDASLLFGEITVPDDDFAETVYSRLRIFKPGSDASDSIPFVMRSAAAMKVRPSSLRFVKVETDQDDRFRARVFVVSEKFHPSPEGPRSVGAILVLGEERYSGTPKRLSRSVFRIELDLPASQIESLDEEPTAGKLMVSYGGVRVEREMPIHFSE